MSTPAEVLDDEAGPAETLTDRPKPRPSDAVVGQPKAEVPTAESPINLRTKTPSGLIALVVVVALVIAGLFFLWRDWDSRLRVCELVMLHPDNTRSLMRLQTGDSSVLDEQHKVVCTPEAQNVRAVIEVASGAIHVFDWPPPAGLECTGTSSCVQLYLGCSGEFTCTERGEDGCVVGSCRED
jgi:hypothetical protein